MITESSESKANLEKIATELRLAREMVNGAAAPYKLFTPELFPQLSEFAPESLIMLQSIAQGSFKSDQQRLEVRDKYPEIWNWPVESERSMLIVYANLGLAEEGLALVKSEYSKRSKTAQAKSSGFGV